MQILKVSKIINNCQPNTEKSYNYQKYNSILLVISILNIVIDVMKKSFTYVGKDATEVFVKHIIEESIKFKKCIIY